MNLIRGGAFALAVWAACGAASALESYALYDNFQATALDPVKWQDGERSRTTFSNTLRLVQRDWGSTTSDTGNPGISWSESLARVGPVAQLRATLKVVAIDMTGCAANPSATGVRGRVMGTFFNSGNRASGSNVGDVFAQVYATRYSNSADAAGVLRVEGWLGMCTASDCSTATQIGTTAALGTVNVGTAVLLQVDWDRADKQFLFSRDKGTATPVSYVGIDDSADPGSAFKSVGTRTTVASCASGPRAFGYIDARFDNVAVNATAKP
jgi:hypothetical protein